MNRLAKAWDDKGQEALYRYNGLGQRTGKTVKGRDEEGNNQFWKESIFWSALLYAG